MSSLKRRHSYYIPQLKGQAPFHLAVVRPKMLRADMHQVFNEGQEYAFKHLVGCRRKYMLRGMRELYISWGQGPMAGVLR